MTPVTRSPSSSAASQESSVFTSGGNRGGQPGDLGHPGHPPGLVVSAVEHHAVLEPASIGGARLAPVTDGGRLELSAFAELLDEEVGLVSGDGGE